MSNSVDPYIAIGLRRNPFIAPESLEIPPQRWLDFGFSEPPISQNRVFWQVIGQKGAGKTSHLLHWYQQTGGVYYYCPRGRQSWQIPPVGAIAYWDEANRIPLSLLLISLIHASYLQSTIVVGTHTNLAWAARLVNLKVKTIFLSTLCVENLIKWTQKAIATERISTTTPIQLELSQEQAAEIVAKSQGSWRIAANHLHIWMSRIAQESMNKRE